MFIRVPDTGAASSVDVTEGNHELLDEKFATLCGDRCVFSGTCEPSARSKRETGDPTHRLDQLKVVLSHLGFFFQFHFVHVPAAWYVAGCRLP